MSPHDQLALPAAPYVTAEFDAIDRERVLARSWQLVAHAAQVRAPGDHALATIGALPLVIVRGEDGVLRALHNVCRHRAGPLATCDGVGARALVCKYHGWTYALDGALRAAPEMPADFDVARVRLPAAQVVEWQGLVFAALGDVPAFASVVAGIDARLGDRGLAGYAFAQRASYDLACNWKVYVDNYLEGYHLPRVHPALNLALDYRSYRTELADGHSLQWSPLDAAQVPYGAGVALYYWLYPNTMLNVLPGRLQTNRVLPLAPDRCRVVFDYFYAAGTDPTAKARDAAFAAAVQAEDIAICEAVQRGLASGSYEPGPLNPTRESGVRHFHDRLRAAYRG